MYGFSDQSKGMPLTWLSATLHGSSRYSVRMRSIIEHTFVSAERVAILGRLIRLDDDLPPSTRAPESGAEVI